MNTNDRYRERFEDDNQSFRTARHDAREAAEAEWQVATFAERKRRQPKVRVVKKYAPLDDAFLSALRADLYARFDLRGHDDRRDAADAAREALLDELAPGVEFTPDPGCWHLLRESSTAGYTTQTDPHTYAKGHLLPDQHRLTSLGFSTYIRYLCEGKVNSCWGSTDWGRYEFWADCPPWMHDAAVRGMTLAEALGVYKAHAINARVYNPFLPYELTG